MFERLLPYYNSELRFMRDLAKEFAVANPKIAGRLRVSGDAIEDPHVSRLIEAFSFISARLRLKLDDEFPELTESLLDLLYPHYLAPIPSMMVACAAPQPGLAHVASVPVNSRLMTEAVDGQMAEYRTRYPIELWPIELSHASVSGLPLPAPSNRNAASAVGVVRLTFRCLAPDQTFAKLGPDRLRLFIHSESRTAQMLFELIVGGVISVALADSAVDERPVILGPGAVQPVGFSREELILPLKGGSEPGYVLLSEFFAFPEKFLFFDLVGLSAKTLLDAGRTLDVFLYVDRHEPALESLVSASDFKLGCAPAINLFPMKADPIRLDPSRFEHRIVPDARRESVLEVYGVEAVVVTDRSGSRLPFRPLFSLGHRHLGEDDERRFWRAARRASLHPSGGDDVFLSFSADDGTPAADRDHVASVDILATNRNLCDRLPFGDGRPRLTLEAPGGHRGCAALFAPTRAQRPRRGAAALWKLISHLSLNQLSISEEGMSLDLVKEMLGLYAQGDGAAARAVIERLIGVRPTAATARAPGGGRIAFASGVDITLEMDDRKLSGSGAFMLAAVLEAAFANLASINSFSRTTLKLKGEKEPWQRWRARSGTRRLI